MDQTEQRSVLEWY